MKDSDRLYMGAIVLLLILIALIISALLAVVVISNIYPDFTLMPSPRPTVTPAATAGVNVTITPTPMPETTASITPASTALAYICSPDRSVHVVDTGSGKTIALIPFSVTPGYAIPSPDGRRLYVSFGSNMSIIDMDGYKVLKTISFDRGIHRMAITPDGSRVYVEINADPKSDVAVIDVANGNIIKTIGNIPVSYGEGMAFSPDGKYLYMTDYWNCELVVIDTVRNEVFKSIRCNGPGSYVFQESFKGHLYWNGGVATDLAVSSDGNYIYVSIWSGSALSVIDAHDLTVVKTIVMPYRSSNSVAISPEDKFVYVLSNDVMNQGQIVNNSITVVSASDGNIQDVIFVSPGANVIRITPDGKYLYVCHGTSNVEVVNTAARSVEGDLGFIGGMVEMGK